MTHTTEHPAVHQLDPNAPITDLFTFAEVRVRAVCNLLKSVSSMRVSNGEEVDPQTFATGAYLLLESGCEALTLVEQRIADQPWR
jgi:hypothetical protein